MTADFNVFRDRTVLVTGSTGFKGSWLCAWLLELGAKVSGFALPPEPDAPLFDQLALRDRIEQHDGDIRDMETVTGILRDVRPEIVIHLAAQALVRRGYAEPKLTFDTNVAGGINLLESIRHTESVRSLVFITSDKAYRNKEWVWGYRENDELGGPDPYGASKAAMEHVFAGYQESYFRRRKNFGAATVRAGNVIGGGDWSSDRIVPDTIRALIKGELIRIRHPDATRPWQHVMEPLSGYLNVAARLLDDPEQFSQAWNFGPETENVRTVRELAERAAKTWGSGTVQVNACADDPHEAQLLYLDNDKASVLLDWRPLWNFDQAIECTVCWYKQVNDGADPVIVTREQIRTFMEASR
jgi:CDP-glucose 4,6-dehydratase